MFIGVQSFGRSVSDTVALNNQITQPKTDSVNHKNSTKKIDTQTKTDYDVVINYVTGEYYYVDRIPVEHVNLCFALTPWPILTAFYINR